MKRSTNLQIERLNYDCLEEIALYLSWRDLYNVAQVESKFQALLRTKLLAWFNCGGDLADLIKEIPQQRFLQLFHAVCPNLHTLKLDCLGSREQRHVYHALLRIANAGCRNLVKLSITDMRLAKFCSKSNMNHLHLLKRLKELHLSSMNLTDDLLIQLLGQNENTLKLLDIRDCKHLNGKFLASVKDLKKAAFRSLKCTPEDFITFLANNKTLRALELDNCSFLNEASLNAIALLPNLDTLHWRNYAINLSQIGLAVAKMPLKKLAVFSNHLLGDFFGKLAETNSLQQLEIDSNPHVEELAKLSTITSLKYLILWGDVYIPDLRHQFLLKSVEFLTLYYWPQQDLVLSLVKSLPCLRNLSMANFTGTWKQQEAQQFGKQFKENHALCQRRIVAVSELIISKYLALFHV